MAIKEKRRKNRKVFNGVASSPGICMGKVHLLKSSHSPILQRKIETSEVAYEISKLKSVISRSIKDLSIIKEQIIQNVGVEESRIFTTHIMILQDNELIDNVIQIIRQERWNYEYSFQKYMNSVISIFEGNSNQVSKDRVADLRDIFNRVVSNMSEIECNWELPDFDSETIIVANDIAPSMFTHFSGYNNIGLATDKGGSTSHVAILAKSMQLTAVAGLKNVSVLLRHGDYVILDGHSGKLIQNPNQADLDYYQRELEKLRNYRDELLYDLDEKSETTDGVAINLLSNIAHPSEINAANQFGAEGVGLFRSEFIFFKDSRPDENFQFENYKQLLEGMYPKPVTIRTLDAGGDKLIKSISIQNENNPFMGWRSIRVCLDEVELFKEQLRAVLRAGYFGQLKIMVPMVSSLEEVLKSKEILAEVEQELDAKGIPRAKEYKVGVMIEVPSAVMLIEDIAQEVDFFSIGTNDLVQFTLAVDRSNDKISNMFAPNHPGVLRMIKKVVEAAQKFDKEVSICGEMAADLSSLILLIGMGVRDLSMNPSSIAACKNAIRRISISEAEQMAEYALKAKTVKDIENELQIRFQNVISKIGN